MARMLSFCQLVLNVSSLEQWLYLLPRPKSCSCASERVKQDHEFGLGRADLWLELATAEGPQKSSHPLFRQAVL